MTTTRVETALGTFEILDETNEPDFNWRVIVASPNLLALVQEAAVPGGLDEDAYILWRQKAEAHIAFAAGYGNAVE